MTETEQKIREALAGEGYALESGTVEIAADPNVPNVWAVRVQAPWDVMEFVVYLDDEPGDQVEEVEFKSWPPTATTNGVQQ